MNDGRKGAALRSVSGSYIHLPENPCYTSKSGNTGFVILADLQTAIFSGDGGPRGVIREESQSSGQDIFTVFAD